MNKRPSISVVTVLGDGSSVLHVMKNQTFFIEYEEFTRRRSLPPVNFKVDYSGEVMLVSDVHVAGKKNPAFDLEGRITGVSNLTLTEGRVFLGKKGPSEGMTKQSKLSMRETFFKGMLSVGFIIILRHFLRRNIMVRDVQKEAIKRLFEHTTQIGDNVVGNAFY